MVIIAIENLKKIERVVHTVHIHLFFKKKKKVAYKNMVNILGYQHTNVEKRRSSHI